MQLSTLAALSLAFSILGIAGLFFFANQTESIPLTIAELLEQKPQTSVRLVAEVKTWKQFSSKTTLSLWDGNELTAFIPANQPLSWKPERGIFEFTGKLVTEQNRDLFWIRSVKKID